MAQIYNGSHFPQDLEVFCDSVLLLCHKLCKCKYSNKIILIYYSMNEKRMNNVNLEGHRDIFQGKTTFENPLANVSIQPLSS